MKTYSPRVLLSVSLLIIGIAIIVGSLVSNYNQSQLERYVHSQLDIQRGELYKLAETTDNNSADEVVKVLVKDCGNRSEYESLLMRLDSLEKKNLLTLQNLSASCGNFYIQQKSIMVVRFERELENYVQLLKLLSVLDPNNLTQYEIDKWTNLVDGEKTRSDLLIEQGELQTEIINELIKGEYIRGNTIQDLVEDAKRVRDLLDVQGKRIDEIRNNINH